jgi:hypothetical protein
LKKVILLLLDRVMARKFHNLNLSQTRKPSFVIGGRFVRLSAILLQRCAPLLHYLLFPIIAGAVLALPVNARQAVKGSLTVLAMQ